ncbi:unnamed protein product [Agarophyton chilense]
MAPSKQSLPSPSEDKVPNGSIIDPTASPLPHKWSALESFQETWEDIKDAVTETPAYISLSSKLNAVSVVAHSAWTLSKKLAWVLGTTSLVLAVPLLYEIDKEMGPDVSLAATSPASPASSASPANPPTDASANSSSAATPASQQS